MSANKIPFKGGDEEDALTKARRFYSWRPGTVKWIKRKYNKRFRRAWRRDNGD